jgi:hypothetical protein
LNIRNKLIVISIHDLSINSDVLIWRENKKWIESFKLLRINDEICKIELSSESIDFQSIVIKSYFIESEVESISENDQSINDVESENVQSTDSSDDENQNSALEIFTRFTRARRSSTRYQNFADITVFLQDEFDSSFVFTLISTFAESRRK